MIGVIGCGNMAQAIVKGFYKKNKEYNFLTYTPNFIQAEKLAKEINGQAVKDLQGIQPASTVIIACKPQQLGTLVEDLAKNGVSFANKHVISILAATPLSTLIEKLGSKKVTRIMPNTPAFLGEGISLILHSEDVEEDQKKFVSMFFEACGKTFTLDSEEQFDKVTTVSGSGPAYVYLFAKTMRDKLTDWGLDEKIAREIVVQLFIGSSNLMDEEKELSLDELIAKVTSKGGVTIEAVRSFENDNLGEITSKALDSAYSRSSEIVKEISNL